MSAISLLPSRRTQLTSKINVILSCILHHLYLLKHRLGSALRCVSLVGDPATATTAHGGRVLTPFLATPPPVLPPPLHGQPPHQDHPTQQDHNYRQGHNPYDQSKLPRLQGPEQVARGFQSGWNCYHSRDWRRGRTGACRDKLFNEAWLSNRLLHHWGRACSLKGLTHLLGHFCGYSGNDPKSNSS